MLADRERNTDPGPTPCNERISNQYATIFKRGKDRGESETVKASKERGLSRRKGQKTRQGYDKKILSRGRGREVKANAKKREWPGPITIEAKGKGSRSTNSRKNAANESARR